MWACGGASRPVPAALPRGSWHPLPGAGLGPEERGAECPGRRSAGAGPPRVSPPGRQAASPLTFLQLADALVQRGQCALDLHPLLRVVPGTSLALLQAVDPGEHLPLQVVDLALQQILEAVGLAGGIEAAVLLRGGSKGGETRPLPEAPRALARPAAGPLRGRPGRELREGPSRVEGTPAGWGSRGRRAGARWGGDGGPGPGGERTRAGAGAGRAAGRRGRRGAGPRGARAPPGSPGGS